MKFTFLLIVCFFLFSTTNSQTKQDSLLLKIKSLPNNKELVDTYLQLGREYENTNLETAFLWVDKAQNLSKKLEYKKGIFNALREKGIMHYYHKKPDSALVYFNKIFTENLAEIAKDSANVYSNIGNAYEAKGEINKALKFLNLALDIYDNLDSDSGLLSILVNMGNCFYEAGNAEQALKYQEKAYKLAIKIEDTKNIPITILNYSMLVLYVENDTTKVDELLSTLLNNPIIKENPNILAAYYQNMAVYYSQTGNMAKSEENFKLALSVSNNSTFGVDSGIHIGLGQIYHKKGEIDKAINQYYKALGLSSKKSEFKMVYNGLAKIYTVAKQIDSATYYWEKNIKLIEELQKSKTQELMLKSKNNLDIIQKENKIKLLEEEQKFSNLNHKINKYTIAGLITLLGLLSVITFLIIKQKKKQLYLKEVEVKLKKQNLVSLSLQINQKNQVLKDFEDNIIENKNNNIDPTLYKDVKKALRQSLRIDKNWKEFELYFNDLHIGFYDNLKDNFPSLTNSELRICSLAKLRFNLKEISQTLFLSVDSVKSARYRIRKKLNLNTIDDLSDFLNNLKIS